METHESQREERIILPENEATERERKHNHEISMHKLELYTTLLQLSPSSSPVNPPPDASNKHNLLLGQGRFIISALRGKND